MAGAPIEFGLYVPQVGFTWPQIRERVLVAEELGFASVWFMDHLYPPELPDVGSFEAWTVATAVATSTTRLRVGHLVLSNTLRHPVLLAKMATTLDVISEGRLDLGIGSVRTLLSTTAPGSRGTRRGCGRNSSKRRSRS